MLSFLQSIAASPRVSASFLSSLPLPAIFPWQPSFGIFNDEGVYSTNYNPESDKPSGTPIWVATTGNDTTGDGSESLPYRSIAKALTEGSIVNIKSGFYAETHGAFNIGVSEDTALIAVDGAGSVILASSPDTLSWALESGNVYRANVSTAIHDVLDLTQTRGAETLVDGSTGLPLPYSEVASIVDCEANAGSFYHSGTILYVHTHDARTPDSDIKPLWATPIWNTSGVSNTIYLEGIEFWGADALLINGDTGSTASKVVAVDCGFRFENEEANARCVSVKECRFVNCAVSDSYEDGFSYVNNSSTFEQNILEVGCTAIRCGRDPAGADNVNCSTSHKNCSVIRVNCVYDTSQGPIIADITGAHSVCFNVEAKNADSDRGDTHRTDASFSVGTFGADDRVSRMWLYDCIASGSGFDRALSSGGLILSDSNFSGGAANDEGVILSLDDDTTPAIYNDLTLWLDFDDDIAVETGGSGIIEVNDKSPRRVNGRQNTSSMRLPNPAVIGGLYNGRKVTSPDDLLDDASLDLLSNITIGDLYIVCSYKDGTDSAFDDAQTLISGTGTDAAPHIMGVSSSADISNTANALSGIAVNGASASYSGILPLPFSILRMTPASPVDDLYTLFRHALTADRGWVGDIAEVLAFETAKSGAEDSALRAYLSAKWDI